MPSWTKEQETAINARNKNLLVSAAAGAGKTAVLVERILRRILDPTAPVDIDRLLVVTFTNAAAQEMRERIARELAARSRQTPQDKRIQRQLLLLGKAAISTLHSFCLDLIRQNYFLLPLPEGLALDPRFRIANDIEAVLLKMEVLEELFEDRYKKEDSQFLELVECFGGERDDRLLQELVLKLYDFTRSQPDPGIWLEKITRVFRANPEDKQVEELLANLQESITQPLEEAIANLEEAEALAALPGGPAVYINNLRAEKESLCRVLAKFGRAAMPAAWPRLMEELGSLAFSSLKACRDKDVDDSIKDEVISLRNKAKDILKKLQEEFSRRVIPEFLEDMSQMAPLMETLCSLVREFGANYLKAKLERNLIDFADIEHFALALLRPLEEGKAEEDTMAEGRKPALLAARLRERYTEILVDEYQDINSVQETIIQLISQGEKAADLFMVGDVKQSIYRFRLAEPGLFLAKYGEFAKFGTAPGAKAEKIVLSRNFRSRQAVVDGVNYVFRQVMCAAWGGIAYDQDAQLVCGASYPALPGSDCSIAGRIQAHLIDCKKESDLIAEGEKEGEEDTGAEKEELDSLQLEAKLVGEKITELLANQVWDKEEGCYRPARYRDIVILLRSTKNTAAVYLDELAKRSIPAYAELGTGYLDALEVQTMLALLKIIDNPRQDIALAAVLRSPIVGLTGEELAQIRVQRARGDYYDALRLAARREKGQLGLEVKKFLRQLRRWRTFSRRNSLVELIWLLFRETGYYEYAGAMPGGKQRQANLRALHDRAKQYEDTAMKGLFKFLRFLEKLEEKNQDLGAARPLGEKEDVVRIMSIHKSKGLEFPIVILAGLGRRFNIQDLREDVLLDKDLGLGPVWVDYQKRLKYPTLVRIAVKNKLKRELLAEEIRILYVAMTRAREGLVLVGTLKDVQRKVKEWERAAKLKEWELPAGMISRAVCFWDWLGPCLLRHPDGKSLRDLANTKTASSEAVCWSGISPGEQEPSNWEVVLWDARRLQGKEERENPKETDSKLARIAALEPLPEKGGYFEFVKSRLGWEYPYAYLSDIPAKLSVTEIKHRYHSNLQDELSRQVFSRWRDFSQRPQFLQAKSGLSSQEKGSALHLVMRHLDLKASPTEDNIVEQIKLMVQKEIISQQQGDSVPVAVIAAFLCSPLGERLRSSKEVQRELSFTCLFPAAEILGEEICKEAGKGIREGMGAETKNEKILVQGTIDCLFAERDGYVLLDYKTDLVTRATLPSLRERYQVQIDLYARAVEKILKKPVQEKVLYSFAVGEAVVI